ncbi:MAG: hypothetical protein PUP92_24105 [Rhizonema sp. PD38]|nr:hypothetical protein [Rhizonema sp. PD38]
MNTKSRLNLLSESETQATDEQSASLEELLDLPFDQLTSVEWELLKQYEPQSDCFLAA